MTDSMPLTLEPPVAAPRPTRLETHGDLRIDDYFWLRERDNPDVIAYLEAENRYTETVMAPASALQEQLYQEMRARIKETDETVPVQIDDFWYYQRTEEGKQYPIFCRKRGTLDEPEEVLLDQNELAAGLDFLRLANFQVSPNHRYLAYAVDTAGAEAYTLRVKDLRTGQHLADEIPNTYYGLEWSNDSQTLYYTVLDPAKRPYRLFRHTLGAAPQEDELVFEEDDEMYFLSVSKSKSKRYIFVELNSKITSEVHVIDADDPGAQPRVIQPRIHGVEYSLEHHGDRFFILTNDQAQNFRVMTAPVHQPDRSHWEEFLPHQPAVKLDRLEMFADHLAIFEREQGLRHIRVVDLATKRAHRVSFPETVYTVSPGPNPNFDTVVLRFHYSSLVTPDSVYDYHMAEGVLELKKQDEVKGYDPSQYETERAWATAADGVRIPISLVYPKGIQRDGNNRMLLYGYGSYGASIEPRFQIPRLSLLERGFIFAIAHIRGGGEMGREWYEDGKFLRKKNTFTDFIAAAEHLIGEGYTRPEKLAIMGRSAGGLLMGAVTNMRPDLFRTVIAGVPFVDVINTMLDPSIPLTVIEYEEWGNPNDPVYYEYMKSYSPYDNVQAKAYPHILVTAGLNDPRVQYWEPAKWVAKLRRMKTDNNRLLLKTNMGAGHAGASGRYDYLKEIAFEYAFLLDTVP
jgi:oligopeptidase B